MNITQSDETDLKRSFLIDDDDDDFAFPSSSLPQSEDSIIKNRVCEYVTWAA